MQKPVLKWEEKEDVNILHLRGALTLRNLPLDLSSAPRLEKNLIIDLSRLEDLDTSGANAVLLLLRDRKVTLRTITLAGGNEDHEKVFKLVKERSDISLPDGDQSGISPVVLIEGLGKWVFESLTTIREYVSLLGQLVVVTARYFKDFSKLRLRELFAQLDHTGIRAVPVVMLVTFLIGIVVAYLLAMQAEKFGASIFVIDGLAIAMCREMSPILVAIIIAGRSGSAFTAQLGAMKITEEIDALKSIGLSYFDVLIFPRIVSLLLVMPLLVFVGDIVGIYGGMLITEHYLNLSSTTFFERLGQVLSLKHIMVGLIKAPVFALAIGMIACRVGINVARDARSVGISTTKTVVESIVMVILINAAFAVIFAELGI